MTGQHPSGRRAAAEAAGPTGAGAPTGAAAPTGRFAAGTFVPAPGRGGLLRMLLAHVRIEALLTLRHGEQLLLTLLIPVALLVGLSLVELGGLGELAPTEAGEANVQWVAPSVLALAVLSSAFTGQAIALGFDRKYGVLQRLSATALPRWLLVTGRVLSTYVVVSVQVLVLGGVALLLGWAPALSGIAPAIGLLAAGTAAFGALGVLLGGALRADIVLAVANVVWFLLLIAGGILVAPEVLPAGLAETVAVLPSGALAEGLRVVLIDGTGAGGLATAFAVLGCWAVGAGALAMRTTRLR